MDILLVEKLAADALAWLHARYSVETRPELAADPGALRKAIFKAEAVVLPRKVPVGTELLNWAPRLRVVGRMHEGTDDTDLLACRERGVKVIDPGVATVRSNAEYLLASLLLLYRRGIGAALAGERHATLSLGRELHGSTVGIFGLAPTAHALALTLTALGARLVGYDPAVHHTAPLWARLQVRPLSLHDMLAQADAISVQVLYAPRYKGFINDNVLAHCKPGQLWVGISRTDVFDPEALARALTDGRIKECLLDGPESGFASRGTPLHELNNLIITPRLGAYTREARLRASWHLAHRIDEALTEAGTHGHPDIPPTQHMGLE